MYIGSTMPRYSVGESMLGHGMKMISIIRWNRGVHKGEVTFLASLKKHKVSGGRKCFKRRVEDPWHVCTYHAWATAPKLVTTKEGGPSDQASAKFHHSMTSHCMAHTKLEDLRKQLKHLLKTCTFNHPTPCMAYQRCSKRTKTILSPCASICPGGSRSWICVRVYAKFRFPSRDHFLALRITVDELWWITQNLYYN